MKNDYYKGKHVLITGGAQGIGRGLVQAFAKAGASVFFTDIDAEAGEEALEWLREQNLQAYFLEADVANENAVKAFFEQISQKCTKLDVLINNAGISSPHMPPLQDLELAAFDRVLAVNLRGPLLCTKYALPLLLQSEHPAVLNISSTRAFMSEPNTFAYSASKGGLEALTHALAVSLGPQQVRVNAISPGWIETGPWQKKSRQYAPDHTEEDKSQHPVGRVGIPEDIAEAALFLCSESAGFITGQSLTIDGGMTVKMIYA